MQENNEKPKYKILKTCFIGDSRVGKSNVLLRITDDKFITQHDPTIGVEFGAFVSQDGKYKIQIWDTAGQESFRSITRAYYRGCSLIVFVFDLTDRASFEHITGWIEDVKKAIDPANPCGLLLIGNKNDLVEKRAVSQEEAENFALANNMMYLDFSAKNGSQVEIREKIQELALKVENTV